MSSEDGAMQTSDVKDQLERHRLNNSTSRFRRCSSTSTGVRDESRTWTSITVISVAPVVERRSRRQ